MDDDGIQERHARETKVKGSLYQKVEERPIIPYFREMFFLYTEKPLFVKAT